MIAKPFVGVAASPPLFDSPPVLSSALHNFPVRLAHHGANTEAERPTPLRLSVMVLFFDDRGVPVLVRIGVHCPDVIVNDTKLAEDPAQLAPQLSFFARFCVSSHECGR